MTTTVAPATSAEMSLVPKGRLPAPEPGVYPGTPMETYHAWDGASNSRLSKLRQSPAHLRAYLVAPPEETAALRHGRAIHAAILEPDDFASRYVAAPEGLDRRTKAGKETWDGLLNRFGEGCVLKADEYAMCLAVRDSVHAHQSAGNLLVGPGEIELSCTWKHAQVDGIGCKARFDRYTPMIAGGAIVDIKTTRDASRREFEKAIFSLGYHRQGAFYLDGAKALGMHAEHFVILAVEKEPPYAVAAYRLTEGAIEAGRDQLEVLLRRYGQCLATDTWPAYPDEVQDIALPPWAWTQIDEEITEATR